MGRVMRTAEQQPGKVRQGQAGATARRVAGFFRPYRLKVLVVLFTIVVTSLLGLINPFLLQQLIDVALPQQNWLLLNVFVALMIITPIVSGLIGIGQTYLNNVIGQHVMQDLRNALYEHLHRLPLRFFTETKTGEIQSRLANDVGGIQGVVTDTAASVASNLVVVISTVIAMLFIDWRLTLLSLGLLPFFMFLTYRVGKVRRGLAMQTQQSLAEISAITEETLSVSGILLSKTFGRQRETIDSFRVANARLARLQLRQSMVGRWFFMIVGSIFSITPALVYWLAGYLSFNGAPNAPTVGAIVAFTTLQSRLFFPLGQLLNVQVEVQGALALFDRIFEYLDLDADIRDAPNAVTLVPSEVRGKVRFRHVWFAYPRQATPEPAAAAETTALDAAGPTTPAEVTSASEALVAAAPTLLATGAASIDSMAEPEATDTAAPRAFGLEDIDFTADAGQLVALVGPSGAGKTTTTYLVPRLYDVERGAVEIDGTDVRQISLASLGQIIGFVTQETYLFHASVRENLAYARPEATDEEIHAAARFAAIHDRIMDLPEGYDTVVGERGYKLSGGEKQRVALARVLLKDPRIMILDEATSALDSVSERLIQTALERVMHGRTTIAIAHRLSTILRADLILVYERGTIVERGTHRDLLEAGGAYARLYHEQFESDRNEIRQMELAAAG
jgi:ATP-binding cassette, subfamily B, bacterial